MPAPGHPPRPDVLTPAEWCEAEWVRHGLSSPAIVARMSVSTHAVKFHIGNVLGKLGLASRRELRRWSGVAAGTAIR